MTNELYKKLARLQWLLHKQHQEMHMSSGPMAGPTQGQGRIIAMLKIKDGISTKELSYLLGIRVSSLNELLMKLEKGDYITRTPFESDKRIILIHLTEKGKNEEFDLSKTDGIFSCLSEEEQKEFGSYLDRVINAWEKKLGITDSIKEMHDFILKAKKN
ncbi:MarR family winged helix-turn-helix transcriptional regulator [Fusobacterium sp. PH5-44]|uniref:MarR family winged helix-turn-helix transcriptional regulator n=1 Tax=unclassified Fusobacterium TaxID=2648384 RepID=UPI003D1ACD3F